MLTIDSRMRDVDKAFAGDGPVFLLGRKVQHEVGVDLRVGSRPLIIVADEYIGTGGIINARGGDGVGVAWHARHGGSGRTVTVLCRRSVNARIFATGGNGAYGSAGSAGSPEVPGEFYPAVYQTVHVGPDHPLDPDGTLDCGHWRDELVSPAVTIPGTPGSAGSDGGDGGSGGSGGSITFVSIVDDPPPTLDGGGGQGGAAGGPGNGEGYGGADGEDGPDGWVTHTNVSEHEYVGALRPVLGYSANYWAPFRIVTGKYFYHMHNASLTDRAHYLQWAAIEFARALELQPDNVEALRLYAQLVGVPQAVEGTDEVVFVGGGNNALGFPPDFDIQSPNFDRYFGSFTRSSALALTFLHTGIETLLAQETDKGLKSIVELQRAAAEAARKAIVGDLSTSVSYKAIESKEADYFQQQLDQTTREIQAALPEMRESEFNLGAAIGTVAEIGIAIVGVAAAIPTFGTSLVALVPAMVSLAGAVTAGAGPIVDALLAGDDPSDIKKIEEEYKTVEKNASAVIKAGKSIVNFVKVVERLSTSTTTPENSTHVALVKRGAELIHRVLIAQNRVTHAQQLIDVTEDKLSGAASVVALADKLLPEVLDVAAMKRRVGMLAIGVAQSQADLLLGFAFMAQRAMEIYTLENAEQYLFLDAGLLSPDYLRNYAEQEEEQQDVGDLVDKLIKSWEQLLEPMKMERDYLEYTSQTPVSDSLRLSFTAGDPELSALQTTRRFSFRVEASGIPAGRADAKVRGVRLALVGAASPAGEITCVVRHGESYEQRRPDGTIHAELLKSLATDRPAQLVRLAADDGLGPDPEHHVPLGFKFWGRGIGGEWEVSISGSEDNAGVDLTGLTEIQVWIKYQYLQ